MAPMGDMRRVVLRSLPLRLLERALQHRDALVREFAFVVHGGDGGGIPARLLEIAAESDERYANLNPEAERQCEAALARGEEFIDVEVVVPYDFRSHIVDAVPVFLEVEQFCREGRLLTLVAPDDLRAFWVWYLSEFVRQIDGHAPSPWPR